MTQETKSCLLFDSCHLVSMTTTALVIALVPPSDRQSSATPTCLFRPAARNCPPNSYFDGKNCTKCSECPIGFGANVPCSTTHDTQCHRCWERYNYLDSLVDDRCISCDTQCLLRDPREFKKCAVSSPPICEGCIYGYFMNGSSKVIGCAMCSPPCKNREVEVEQCTPKHEPSCRLLPGRPVKSGTTGRLPVGIPIDIPNGTSATPFYRDMTLKGLLLGLAIWTSVVILVFLAVLTFVTYRAYKRRVERRKNKNYVDYEIQDNTSENRFLLVPKGLDRCVKDLNTHERKIFLRELSGKDICGNFRWRAVAEKLGDPDVELEYRGWEAPDNNVNIDKFLATYGEKEGSTISRLVKTIREAGLQVSANKLDQYFSKIQDPQGLDRYIKDLKTQERRIVMRELQGKDSYGYFRWRAVMEELDDPDLERELGGQVSDDNDVNIGKFLTAYGEKEGSSIRRLVKAIREAGLQVSANNLEQHLSTTQDPQGEGSCTSTTVHGTLNE